MLNYSHHGKAKGANKDVVNIGYWRCWAGGFKTR